MSKIDNKYNNPIDVLLEKLYSPMIPFLHRIGVTPNMLTTLSLICGVLSASFIFQGKPKQGAILFLLNYLFDCMDGHMARRFKMESKFGDWYDHISDWVTALIIGYALIKNNNYKPLTNVKILFVLLFLILSTMKWMGCQELMYNGKVGDSVSGLKRLCNNPHEELLLTKYLGFGTLNVFIFIVIYFSKHK